MDFDAVLIQIQDVILATWPEITGLSVKPRRLYTSIQALRMSFVEDARSGAIELPCAVIDLGSDFYDSGWGLTNNTRRARLAIYYVDKDLTTQGQIHAKLTALMDAFEAADQDGTLTEFQMPEGYPNIDSGPTSDVNQSLVADSAVRLAAGHIEWDPGLIV